ncbi:efflux RND transporter periplasmic adaptor subunit [Metabacillus elymi]|uniref:HlyD family efflux transporter periplasmic adaptor subunit n=1 Tax=Metabacillus elymi TaxID=2745198 RepID=A0ABX6RZT3_9BACI|nr:HlyD family efflux transporter periplasmic adaptor subunit [Metabacillus sp. KUDC1714]QNF26747.1 HlyD family efflux transporter periplasmic adaptor subunit [Metabacillus sp. KUDC1714]
MKKWIISIVVVVLVIGGGATAYGIFNSKKEAASVPVTETQTAVAELGNVEVKVSGTGSISTINEEIITAEENNAVVEEVLVTVGDTVEEGDDLITFEDDDLDPIEAPFSGEITTLNVEAEDTLSMGTEMIEVTDYSNLQMVVNVDELDIAKVKVGQTAQIDVSALTDSEFTGTVTSVSKEANESESSSVAQYAVNVKINKPTGIKVGMTAEAVITTESKTNVLTVPIEAVQTQDDQYYVRVQSSDVVSTTEQTKEQVQSSSDSSTSEEASTQTQATQKTVEVGLKNEEVAEIISGLSEGEEVVLPTLQSSDDSESGMQDMNMMKGFPGGDMPQGGMGQGGGNRGGNNQ